jgi:hypothetical protein
MPMRTVRAPQPLIPASAFLAMAALISLLLAPLAAEAETVYKYINDKGEIVFTDQPTKGAQKINIVPPPVIPLTPINLPTNTPPPAPAKPSTDTNAPKPATPMIPSVQMQPPDDTPAVNIAPSKPVERSAPTQNQITAAPANTTNNAPRIIRQPLPETQATESAIPPQKRNGHYQSLVITEPKAGPVTAHAGGTIFVQTKLSPVLDQSVGDRMRIVIDGNIRVDDSTGQRFMISDLSPGTHAIIAIVMRHGKNIFQSNPVVIHLSPSEAPSAQK